MLQLDIQSEYILLRYEIKQKKADYENEMVKGAQFDQLKIIQIEIKELENKRRSYLQEIETLYELV